MPYIGTGGNDTLSTNEQLNFINYFGLEGDDLLLFGNKTGDPIVLFAVYLEGGIGNDVLSGNISGDTLVGDVGNDIAFGNGGRDFIDGGYGDDVMNGNADSDQLAGGFGDDLLAGESGEDSMDGGFGSDTLQGGSGADLMFGGQGFDIVSYGDSGAAIRLDLRDSAKSEGDAAGDLFDSIERFIGSNLADVILGSDAGDDIDGSNGSDSIDGRGGNDFLSGGGDLNGDRLAGGDGDDFIDGRFGNDTIIGGAGADFMSGQEGNDTFVFEEVSDSGVKAATRDQIDGFEKGDLINLRDIDANEKAKGDQKFTIDTGGKFKVGELKIVERIDEIIIQLNTRGNDSPEMTVVLFNADALAATDFIL